METELNNVLLSITNEFYMVFVSLCFTWTAFSAVEFTTGAEEL